MVKKPSALKITGNTLEEFLPLLPAEEELRKCAAAGDPFKPKGYTGKRPSEPAKENQIRSEFLSYLISGKCEKSPIHQAGLIVHGIYVDCKKMPHLDLRSSLITSAVSLKNCYISGPVGLLDGTFNTLEFSGCFAKSLHADRSVFNGSLFLSNKFEVPGEASFIGAKIKGNFVCKDGNFKRGLNIDNAEIGGNLFLNNEFTSTEPIKLRNTRIGGSLICKGGKFLDPNTAIAANRAKIDGNVDLENMVAHGTIALTGSEIGGDFQPQNAQLSGSPALQLRNTKIGGTLHWRGIDYVNGEVDLSGAACTTLNTGKTSWMRKAEAYEQRNPETIKEGEQARKADQRYVKLDNFRYQGFTNLPDDSRSAYWINWLKQQPDEHLHEKFKPRPWEQLAGVLDSMGFEEEARDVRIEKQHLQTQFMRTHEPLKFSKTAITHWAQIVFRKLFWGPLVSYGYRPGNAILWLFVFILFGTAIYGQASRQGIMTPTHPLIYKEARQGGSISKICAENWVYFPDRKCVSEMPSEYSEFHSFVYALDVALPVVNFRMEDDWSPRVTHTDGSSNRFGHAVRIFEWILIAAGWILSLLFVSAVGSSLRR